MTLKEDGDTGRGENKLERQKEVMKYFPSVLDLLSLSFQLGT